MLKVVGLTSLHRTKESAMRIFLTGGTGLVGSRLTRKLRDRGDDVVLLTRRSNGSLPHDANIRIVTGDPSQPGDWMSAIHECDGVVNLVGEGIFNHRWNDSFKETMRKSRIESTRNVVTALEASPRRADGSPKVLVSASAIGVYGPHGDEELTETSAAGEDYLARVCVEWEEAARKAESAGVRVVIMRIGVVLDSKGGALSKMLMPFKLFVGGPVGDGRQVMSWIHHDDLVGEILFALDNDKVAGPMNATAPTPVSNKVFSNALGRVLHRPALVPTPAFALRLALGEVADVVTKGQRVLPKKATEMGYQFKYTNIDAALVDILGHG
jgi:uncharacterized protein (TIGR01777 family)